MLSCTSCLHLLQITVDWQDMPGPDGLLPKPDSALSGVQEARGKVGIAGLLSVYALCFACAKATTAKCHHSTTDLQYKFLGSEALPIGL